MAGYSGTPLATKLGIKEGHSVALIGAPTGFEPELASLPATAKVIRGLRGKSDFDVIVLFVKSRRALHDGFAAASARLRENGGLWVSWPKKASAVATDITEDFIRAFGLATGLVDNKVCAVNDTWSGLRFVVRLKDRKHV